MFIIPQPRPPCIGSKIRLSPKPPSRFHKKRRWKRPYCRSADGHQVACQESTRLMATQTHIRKKHKALIKALLGKGGGKGWSQSSVDGGLRGPAGPWPWRERQRTELSEQCAGVGMLKPRRRVPAAYLSYKCALHVACVERCLLVVCSLGERWFSVCNYWS